MSFPKVSDGSFPPYAAEVGIAEVAAMEADTGKVKPEETAPTASPIPKAEKLGRLLATHLFRQRAEGLAQYRPGLREVQYDADHRLRRRSFFQKGRSRVAGPGSR